MPSLIIFALALCLFLTTPAFAAGSAIRVGLFVDRGASDIAKANFRRLLENRDDLNCTEVYGDDIRDGALKSFDALIIPGGSAGKDAISLGPEAREEIRRFVNDGGIYMGVCAGAYLASSARDNYLGLFPLTTVDQKHWYRVDDGTPVDVQLTALGMQVFGIAQPDISIVYENGPIFPPIEKPNESFRPLGFFRSEVVADGGERGVMLGAPAMILSRYGRGIVLAISPHPEKTPGLGKVLLHALHWLYDQRSRTTQRAVSNVHEENAKRVAIASPGKTSVDPVTAAANPSRAEEPADASNLGAQALKLAESVFQRAKVVEYVHRQVPAAKQVVEDPDGTVRARTDCSGFVSYIVHAIGPRHYRVIRQREPDADYPQAKIWARFFDTLDSTQATDGWLSVSNWRDLRPGDFIAWKEGKVSSAGNTGHVMIAASRPSAVQQSEGVRYFQIEVIDSSSTYHFAPEYLPPRASQTHRDGLGMGAVRIILSDNDSPIGYWAGTYWGEGGKDVKGPTYSDLIRFARMVPMADSVSSD